MVSLLFSCASISAIFFINIFDLTYHDASLIIPGLAGNGNFQIVAKFNSGDILISSTMGAQIGNAVSTLFVIPVAKNFTTPYPTKSPATKSPTKSPTTKSPTRTTTSPTTNSPTKRPTTKSPTNSPATKSPTKRPTTKSPTRAPLK